MTPFEPLPAPARAPLDESHPARRAFEIAGRVIVMLGVLGGVAYMLATATGQI
jgi:hypothetical protein